MTGVLNSVGGQDICMSCQQMVEVKHSPNKLFYCALNQIMLKGYLGVFLLNF